MANEYTILQSDGVTSFLVHPLESNGPNNNATGAITGVTLGIAGVNFFDIEGDLTNLFIASYTFVVAGSTANDNTYTVTSSSYDAPSNTTSVIVTIVIPNATVDGNINYLNGDPVEYTKRQINSLDETGVGGVNFFRLRGDVAYRFVLGFTFDVIGSAGNDGTYTVTSNSVYSSGPNTTTIIVDEDFTSAAVPIGNIQYTNPDVSTSIIIPGRGVGNYGEQLAINSVRMLENFASSFAPVNPIIGQLWYDSANDELNVYDGVSFASPSNLGDPHYTSDSPDGTLLVTAPVASGADALAMGDGASALSTNSLAIGPTASVPATSSGGIAIGSAANVDLATSIAIGLGANATGIQSVAIGGAGTFSATAHETYCVAVGPQSQAGITAGGNAEQGAVAVGRGTFAYQEGCIALGFNANSGIDASTSEGQAIAIGRGASALKLSTIAMGWSAGSYGVESIAIGTSAVCWESNGISVGRSARTGQTLSAAIEIEAIALGNYSEARETGCITVGFQAFAGRTGTSVDPYGIAIGYSAKAYEEGGVALGYLAVAGNATGTLNHFATAVGYSSNAASLESTAVGYSALANANYTLALGTFTHAQALRSIAIGNGTGSSSRTVANGEYGIALGYLAEAGDGFASGRNNQIAIGNQTEAYCQDGIAIGASAKAGSQSGTDVNSIAIGKFARTPLSDSIAIGWHSSSFGLGSIAIGDTQWTGGQPDTGAFDDQCIAIGAWSKAGIRNETTNYRAIAIGYQTDAANADTIAIGHQARIRETAGIAERTSVDFTGHNIIGADYFNVHSSTTAYYVWYTVDAVGVDPAPGGTGIVVAILAADTDAQVATKTADAVALDAAFTVPAPGAAIILIYNVVVGAATDATDGANATGATISTSIQGADKITTQNSVAIGRNSDVKGPNAIAISYFANADGDSSMAIGESANSYEADSIAIGRLATAGVLSGSAAAGTIAIGANSDATNLYAISIGNSSNATADRAVSIGESANATGNWSVAAGAGTDATAQGTVCVGYLANADSADGIAIGRSADSNVAGTIAIGANAVTSHVGEIKHSVGTGIHTKRVVITQVFTLASLIAFTDSPVIPDNTAWKFVVNVVARQDTSGDVASYKFDGLIKRIAGTVSLIGTNTKQVEEEDATWDCEVVADDTGKRLEIQFQTDAVTNVNVLADILITEI